MRMYRLCELAIGLLGLAVGVRDCRADQVVCTTDGIGNDTCDVILPNVLGSPTPYPNVQFFPGDTVTVSASGCVQTGGKGKTWKDYVHPEPNSALYHGLITIPGATGVLVPISVLQSSQSPLPPSTGGILTLGYTDNNYSDNGYWSHDDGDDNQCANTTSLPNMGRATVHLVIHRAKPIYGPGTVYGMCQQTDILHETCHIDRPDVTQSKESFPSITFLPGDTVSISADGCVQTGGKGATWKDYVHPLGSHELNEYHGLISIPGSTAGLVPISSLPSGTPLPTPSSGGTLTLGYVDNVLGDNGYYSHDNGTEDQCRGKGAAEVTLNITHPAPKVATAISAGFLTTCETDSTHRLFCFGEVVGNGTSGAHLAPTLTDLGPVVKFALSNDLPFGCALSGNPAATGAGPVWCWIGSGAPAPVQGLPDQAVDISVGGPGACAVLVRDRSVWCWGLTPPDGNTNYASAFFPSTPSQVPGLPNGIAQVSVGINFACAVNATDGQVNCWGKNDSGQLGRGVVGAQTDPELDASVPVVNLTARQVAAGTGHACAVATDTSVQCWGASSSGQLGNGANSAQYVPTPQHASGINNAVEVAAGAAFSCAALSDGTGRCWGQNLPTDPEASTLGDGFVISANGGTVHAEKPLNAFTPLPVKNLTGASLLSTGTTHACALHSNGEVSCWGTNEAGQLTDYTTNPTLVPVTP
jgi:Regulator of chromosome condensation (RCC1) repeat